MAIALSQPRLFPTSAWVLGLILFALLVAVSLAVSSVVSDSAQDPDPVGALLILAAWVVLSILTLAVWAISYHSAWVDYRRTVGR